MVVPPSDIKSDGGWIDYIWRFNGMRIPRSKRITPHIKKPYFLI
jgi:hypothetical protein